MDYENQEPSQYYRRPGRDSNLMSQKRGMCRITPCFVFSECAKRIVFSYLAMVRQGRELPVTCFPAFISVRSENT
jgi:hypothetical protein